jgi:ParB family transcriptional regulator, chromosome partitioning protein
LEPSANLPEVSQAQAATMLNVSERSVRSAKTALDQGVPELVRAVEKGEIAVSSAAQIASLPDEEQRERIQPGGYASLTGNNEWYTPTEYIECARRVMNSIDLDPASNDIAQRTVKADRYFTVADDGLAQEWQGRVWLNPPYSQPQIQQFIEKLVAEYESGRMSEAILLVNNSTDAKWFQTAAAACSAICFTRGRITVRQSDRRAGRVARNGTGFPLFRTVSGEVRARVWRDWFHLSPGCFGG